MKTVRAIAFRGQFEACVNGAFELRSGSRQERWDGVRACVRACVCECVRACVRACVTVRGGDDRAVGPGNSLRGEGKGLGEAASG